jgi:hypothetical protein
MLKISHPSNQLDVDRFLKRICKSVQQKNKRWKQLITFNEEDEYTVKTATNIKEATALIESCFQYVTEMDGTKLFRKSK